EEKEFVDQILQSQQAQSEQQAQQMAPVTEAMIANYKSIIEERIAKMENERAKVMQGQEKLMLEQEKIANDKQKQLDDLMLKLTEMEQKYGQQLNQEAANNREVTNGVRKET
ncbi:MAG TPA: hypothetical protein VK999_08995, partial [Methylotenera sp.]|nr:hypothetical protein [Methylotenera sp.]